MIYKILWTAAALVGTGNLIMFFIDPEPATILAAVVCAGICGLTYETTWRKHE